MNTEKKFTEEICVGHRLHLYAREFGRGPYASIIPLTANCDGGGTKVLLRLMSQSGTREKLVTVGEPFELALLREWDIIATVTVTEMRLSFGSGWRLSILVQGWDEYKIKGEPHKAD